MRQLLILMLSIVLSGCAGSDNSDSTSSSGFFRKPFNGNYLNSWPFDHQYPTGPFSERCEEISESHALTWRGELLELDWDTRCHNGHDWVMPDDTPLFAVAEGEVVFAEAEEPFTCHDKGEVSALIVKLRHTLESGEQYESLYAHLNKIEVVEGQFVSEGQQIGLSGSTGCVTGPHLHFAVYRLTSTNDGSRVAVDPFGWSGSQVDPWSVYSGGAESIYLWKSGEVPSGDYGEIVNGKKSRPHLREMH